LLTYVRACEYLPSYSLSASITKQSAPPSVTERTATAASALGFEPYTYCHAHTRSPPAFSALTSDGVNCDQ
jgi:hypothetical protein